MTAQDGVLTGRKVALSDSSDPLVSYAVRFNFWTSLYADDTALLFASRRDLELGTRLLMSHLKRFGLVMHCGVADEAGRVVTKSKTEASFYPPSNYIPTKDDTDILRVDDGVGIVTFTSHFRYLGVIVSSSLTDVEEIERRLTSASAAFGALRKGLFRRGYGGSLELKLKDKGKIYSSLVLGILLYGCESWVLSQELRQKLDAFHNRCVRAMCNVTRYDSAERVGARLAKLYATLNLTCIDEHIKQRKLRWLGHVMRMDFKTRMPRMFMSSWVDAPRPKGRSCATLGHDYTRYLRQAGFNLDRDAIQLGVSEDWIVAVKDRIGWRRRAMALTRQVSTPISDPDMHPAYPDLQASAWLTAQAPAASPSAASSSAGDDAASSRAAGPQITTWAQRLRPRG